MSITAAIQSQACRGGPTESAGPTGAGAGSGRLDHRWNQSLVKPRRHGGAPNQRRRARQPRSRLAAAARTPRPYPRRQRGSPGTRRHARAGGDGATGALAPHSEAASCLYVEPRVLGGAGGCSCLWLHRAHTRDVPAATRLFGAPPAHPTGLLERPHAGRALLPYSQGYSKCILVAHDWGALLAWNFSIYYPSLVDRMVVVSAAPMSVYQDYSLHHIGQFFRSNYMFLFQLPWLPEKLLSMSDFQILKTTLTHRKRGIPQLTPSELEAFLYDFSQPGGLIGPLNYYRNIFRTFPLEPQELATPTLLLWGEKDPYFEQGLVEAISSRFVPGRLEAHILPGMGHWIPQTNPVEMHQYMWAFLQDLLD
ncbi:epoxide hydrolase 3 isoform X4 [Bubalus kerabau]|uniref:epoxide hydrolase 3 isoform X4 n=1 Tax=Bubalus carabanensis TaxID=3119969 RepID=UPI00244E91C8|nr:epoxide hydrolase 3 isoform X4 [Bubalus carabanensis]